MGSPFKDCFGGCFKTKETRDSNNNSNESQRGTNFLRDSFRRNQPSQDASPSYRSETFGYSFLAASQRREISPPHRSEDANLSSILSVVAGLQRQEISSSHHPETVDDSSVNSSPADSRRRETSSSHDGEIADRLQLLLAERQRQEISSSHHPETSDHDSADFRPSQQMVRLKNGSEVLAGDIPPIMQSLEEIDHEVRLLQMKVYCQSSLTMVEQGRLAGLTLAFVDLERKCKDPNYRLSNDSQKFLKEKRLIDKYRGKLSDSVKNIVLSRSQSNSGDGSPVAEERVKLKNGAEEDQILVKTVMSLLRPLRAENPGTLSELHKFCQDQNYIVDNDTTEVLKSKNLINKDTGKPHKAIENIVLSSFDEKSGELRSPAMPLDELEKRFQKRFQKEIYNLARDRKTYKELLAKATDPGESHESFKEVRKEIENINQRMKKLKEDFNEEKEVLKYLYPPYSAAKEA